MKILSIEKTGLHRVELWVEDGEQYKKLALFDDDKVEELASVPVAKYDDYEHFVGVMGKFNPYTIFRKQPVFVEILDFEELIIMANGFEKEAREYNKEQNNVG